MHRHWILALVLTLGQTACDRQAEPDRSVMIYAAASLRDAVFELAGEFQRLSGFEPRFNLAGSNVLALQIDAAPAADVYLSADEQWMDFLVERDRIDPASRQTFLSNRLVIIVNRDHPLTRLEPRELAGDRFRFLSLADPEAVPAGRYARQFLRSIQIDGVDLWSALRHRIAPTPDVRAALGLVEAEPDIVGIVYRTDARASDRVRIVYQVPPEEGPEIRYAAAVVRDGPNPEAGRRFIAFLDTPQAAAVFASHGFVTIPAEVE